MSSHVSAARECLIGDRRNADIKTVSELVSESKIFVEDGNHGENRPRQDEFCEKDGGIPFLRPPDLKDGRVDFKNCDFINEQGFARVRKGIGKPGDVILTHRATVGRIAITRGDAPSVFVTNPGTTIWRSLDKDLLNQRYLYFYMSSKIFQDRLFSEVGHTSTFDYVSLTQQRTLPVVIPEIRLQRHIAHILGTLDDKIELNRKTNETLEAMAKALFKSWFVDFDPVRAKAEGRPTGLPSEISDLFPDSFEDSELGEIPSGWRVGCLSDCCEITMGQSPPGDTYNEDGDGLPFYQGKTDFGFRFPGRRIYCSSPTRQASIGATLISVRAPVGSANIAREICSIGRGIAALKSRQSADSFVYYLIGTLQNVFESYNSEGTVFGAINGKDLASIQVVSPSIEAITAFNSQCLSMDESIIINTLETDYLTAVRDTLLPKLISGKLRIPDAEKLLEAVLS
jgi:type I restriction enzyme S subunit